MKKRIKLLILISVNLVILLILYCYRPLKISNVAQEFGESSVKIIHLKGSDDVIKMNTEFKNYELDGNSAKAKEIFNLFTKYYLHSSIDTLTSNTQVSGDLDDSIHIRYGRQRIDITDKYKIMIDGKTYKIGYFSRKKSKQLVQEIISILESN